MLILNKKDLEELLPMEEVLDVLAMGFREVKEGRCVVPVWFHIARDESTRIEPCPLQAPAEIRDR